MRTKVAIYVEKEWQFKMYFELFKELLPNATIIKYTGLEAMIQSDTHKIIIYGYPATTRGHKNDAIITLVDNKEFNDFVAICSLTNSKFLRERYNE